MSVHFCNLAVFLGKAGDEAEALKVRDGRLLYMGASTFVSFALEAFINEYGETFFPGEWKSKHEMSKSKDKLKIIAAHISFPCDFGKEPFCTFGRLIKSRNDTAHPKYEEHFMDYSLGHAEILDYDSGRISKFTGKQVSDDLQTLQQFMKDFSSAAKAKGYDFDCPPQAATQN